MDLNALTLLVEILDAGNLSAAARKLKMTRANVSYHLKELERAVGLQLVRRTTRRLEPTEIGLRLYQHGLAIQNELLEARESILSLAEALQGRVRLGVPSGYGQLVMSHWLIEFKRLYPGIVLDVVFDNRLDNLLRDKVDIAVRVLSEPPSNLVARPLGSVRYVACAAATYAREHAMPATPDALRSVPLITSAIIGRQLRVSACQGERREEIMIEPTLVSENFVFLRQAILAGLGVGLVPDYVVADEVARGDVVTALEPWQLSIFGTQMFLLYMPNRHHTRATATFISFILDKIRDGGQLIQDTIPPLSVE